MVKITLAILTHIQVLLKIYLVGTLVDWCNVYARYEVLYFITSINFKCNYTKLLIYSKTINIIELVLLLNLTSNLKVPSIVQKFKN